MRSLFCCWLVLVSTAAAQTWVLGGASDPCKGGSAYTFPSSPAPAIPTLRYDPIAFSCTFQAAAGRGAYLVKLEFVETGAAAAAGARLFNVYIQDQPAVIGLDLWASGATSVAVVIARTSIAFTGDGNIQVKATTSVRNAVLSRVTLTQLFLPLASLPDFVVSIDAQTVRVAR